MYYPLRNMEAKCVLNAISADVTILASHFSQFSKKKKGCGLWIILAQKQASTYTYFKNPPEIVCYPGTMAYCFQHT